MTSHRLRQHLLALTLPAGYVLTPLAANAQGTWNGTTNSDWGTGTNWGSGIPAPNTNVTISDSATNGLNVDSPRTINQLIYGTSGTRASSYTLNTQTATNVLSINGGINAGGAFTASPVTAFALRGHFTVATPQTWTVGGSAAHATDQGLSVREITTGAAGRGSLTLSSNLTKNGIGQIMFVATDVVGSGDLIIDAGDVKINAGASQPVVFGGTGKITVNNASTLAIYKNSGTMAINRAIVLNGTATLATAAGTNDIASNISVAGTGNVFNFASTTNLSGAITGSSPISRTGAGTGNFSGALSGYTGTLTASAGTTNLQTPFGGTLAVTGGTLTAGSTVAGNVTTSGATTVVNLNGAVAGNVSATAGTTNVNAPVTGTLTQAAGSTLGGEGTVTGGITLNGGNLNVAGATAGSLGTTGNLTLNGTTTVNITSAPLSLAPFTVLSYGGTLTGGTANLALAGAANYRSPAFSTATPGVITLSALSETRTWVGNVSTLWDVNTAQNWLEGDKKFLQLDAVRFTETGAGTVAITGVLAPLSITIDSDLDYTFTAAANNLITGGATLAKSGTGVTTLGGVNTFTGNITVSEGTLKPSGNQAFGIGPKTITISGGGMLDTNGLMTANRDYDAVVSGTGVADAGAIVNTGAGHNFGFRSLTLAADATIGGTGRWDLRPVTAGQAFVDLANHTLTKVGTNTVAFVDGNLTNPGTININEGLMAFTRTTVSGTGDVNVSNGATLQLENYTAGSFTKPIKVNSSILRNQGANFNLGTGVVMTGDCFVSVGAASSLIMAEPISGAANLEKTDTGTWLTTATNTYSGNTKISAGAIQLGSGGTTGSINNNPIELVGTGGGLRINRSDDFTFSTVITGGGITGNALDPSAFNKDGPNTLTLVAENTYTGTTRLGGGMIAIGSDASVFGASGALIDLRSGGIRSSDTSPRTIPQLISFSSSTPFGSPGTGKLTFTGTVNYGNGTKVMTVNNDEIEFANSISGGGDGTFLEKAGPGKVILSGINTYSQITRVSAGVLQIGNGGTTGSFGTKAVENNSQIIINRANLEGEDHISIGNAISGSGSLTNAGPSLTVLEGANTYTGDTIITNGGISLSAAMLADTSSVRISGSGKLELLFAGQDVVNKLFLNGVGQAPGKWGRTGSIAALGADHESAAITGDGLLNVTTDGAATPYSTWADSKGLNGSNNDPAADPDVDGVVNLAEFGFDGNPLSGATGGKVVVKVANVGGTPVLTLTLPIRTGVGAFTGTTSLTATGDGVTYTIEGSDALAPNGWTLDIDEVTGSDAADIQSGLPALSGAGWSYRTFRAPGDVAGDPTDFLRARVE